MVEGVEKTLVKGQSGAQHGADDEVVGAHGYLLGAERCGDALFLIVQGAAYFVGHGAGNAFEVAAEEKPGQPLQIHLDYLAAPRIEGSTFLLVDPMLATGGSLELAYKAFLRHGTPSRLHVCCVIASEEGIRHLQSVFPSDDVTLWVAAIDPCLNADAYIVPGLGDAGDLAFGEKL